MTARVRRGVFLVCVGAAGVVATGWSSTDTDPAGTHDTVAETPTVPDTVAVSGTGTTSLPVFTVNTSPSFNGLGQLPAMGWSSWAAFQLHVSAELLIQQAEALVSSGLAASGYRYINVDAGWMAPTRDTAGRLVVDADKFPEGLKSVIDRVHAMGLGFGIYTDASNGRGCADLLTASYGHEREDFAFFLSLGIDYLKVDGCYVNVIDARPYPELAREAFGIWSTLIAESGAPIYLSQQAPAYALINDPASRPEMVRWSATVSNSWRTGTDIANATTAVGVQWQTILKNLEDTLPFADHAGPGHFNDPDFLIVGNGISLGEARVQLATWAMMAAPLLLSTDLSDLEAAERDLLTNPTLISVDQDPLGVQGRVIDRQGGVMLMLKPLEGDRWAVLSANLGDVDARFRLPLDRLVPAGVPVPATVTNVFAETVTTDIEVIEGHLPPHDAEIFVVDAQPTGDSS